MATLVHPTIEPWIRRTPDALDLQLFARDAAQVDVLALIDNELETFALVHDGDVAGFTRWRGRVPWCGSSPALRYAFRARTGASACWLGAAGPAPRLPRVEAFFRVTRAPVAPAWAAAQVVYQIFPDRFARAAAGPVQPPPQLFGAGVQPSVALAWGAPLPAGTHGQTFHGGDLAGIVAHLDHLQRTLGVSTLYLTPVFAAQSNHRYDTVDYTRVDPLLGGDEALAGLAAALRARGLRLVLDAVLNHTGAHHPWADRHRRHDPAQRRPHHYARTDSGHLVGWKGHDSLPVLDYANPAVMAAMVSGPDSVLRRWLRPPVAADGWRLDVAHMIGEGAGAANNAGVMREIRRAIKSERADALVVGEHFHQADAWLQGDQEDGAMNYWGFTRPLWAWVAGRDFGLQPAAIDGREFMAWATEALAAVPYEVQLAGWSHLGSHDVPRFLTAADGDVARLAAALALQFTWPGVPCVYYGDEIGLEGGADPDNRRCFPWDPAAWKADVLALHQTAIALRHARAELQRGAWQPLAAEPTWIAFARHDAGAVSLCVVACAAAPTEARVPLDALPLDLRGRHWTATRFGVDWPAAVGAEGLTVGLSGSGALVLSADPPSEQVRGSAGGRPWDRV